MRCRGRVDPNVDAGLRVVAAVDADLGLAELLDQARSLAAGVVLLPAGIATRLGPAEASVTRFHRGCSLWAGGGSGESRRTRGSASQALPERAGTRARARAPGCCLGAGGSRRLAEARGPQP